jgi:predicted glutamine amidotransferase
MCRLLGVVAAQPAPLSQLLTAELEPFIRLACEHPDGWGVSYVDAGNAVVTVKEPVSALASTSLDRELDRAVTSAAILHLRLADPGSAHSPANTHPFGDARCGFAHNGQFSPATALDRTLGGDLRSARGDTDSERYYLAIRARMHAGRQPAAAIAEAATDIRELADHWESTNCLLLTPGGLFGYADHSADSRAIGRRGPDFFDMRWLAEADRVLVASTGWQERPDQWRGLAERQVLHVGRDLTLTVHGGRAADDAPGLSRSG